jgi:putative hydrolase of the HAD superfamily
VERSTITHLLFDFFGTLVEYSPSRTAQGYAGTHALLREAGCALDYEEFLALWSVVSAEFDERAARDQREFSMQALGVAFLERAIGAASDALVHGFVDSYLAEWNQGVRDIAGLSEMLCRLAGRYPMAVVTNTHDRDLVPGHLRRIGVADLFGLVVTSVEHGKRKPDPGIFHHTVRVLGAARESCLFIGDDYEADYRGARAAGMQAILVEPGRRSPVRVDDRLDSILELEDRLAGWCTRGRPRSGSVAS